MTYNEKIKEAALGLEMCGIVPVIVINDKKNAAGAAYSLLEGGIGAIEITMRTPAALSAMAEISKDVPEITLIAGTVLTPEDADRAFDNGCRAMVSPGLGRRNVEHAIAKGYPIIPGVATPTEIEAALEYGLEYLKFFPAETLGGVAALKALSAPYAPRGVKFMPTGGVDFRNAASYLALPTVFACGSSKIATASMIENGDFDAIMNNAKTAFGISHPTL